ncbi:MAG: hypothetical protein ACK5LQ_05615 [Planctomycetota bacterium]
MRKTPILRVTFIGLDTAKRIERGLNQESLVANRQQSHKDRSGSFEPKKSNLPSLA